MGLLLTPEQQWRRRLMIVKLCVLISLQPHAMARACCPCQECGSCSAVKVVDHVITGRPDLLGGSRACDQTTAFQDDDVVGVRVIVEHRRDPIFDENVDLCVREEPS